MTKSSISLPLVALALLTACPLAPKHPYDEQRCAQTCTASQTCFNGACVDNDSGPSDAPDATPDTLADAGHPPRDTLSADADAQSPDTTVDGPQDSFVGPTLVLSVTPNEAFNATADEGSSPFPADKTYTLVNLSQQSISYGVGAGSGSFYEILPATTGSITAGGSTSISLKLVATYPFKAGTFTDTVRFSSGTEFYDRPISVTIFHAGKDGWTKPLADPILTENQGWPVKGLSDAVAIGTQANLWYLGVDVNENTQIGKAIDYGNDNWWAGATPVLKAGTTGAWDEVLGPFTMHYDGSLYHLWYTGRKIGSGTKSSVGYASSTDGDNWTKDTANPVFETDTAAWDKDGVSRLSVIRDGGLYKMWYTSPSGGYDRLGYATSTDGHTWAPQGELQLSVTTPIDGLSVMREGAVYRMWYGISGEVFYASSHDGATWTPLSQPLLGPGGTGAFDSSTIGGFSVVRHTPTLLRMYYTGNGTGIGLATSAPP